MAGICPRGVMRGSEYTLDGSRGSRVLEYATTGGPQTAHYLNTTMPRSKASMSSEEHETVRPRAEMRHFLLAEDAKALERPPNVEGM